MEKSNECPLNSQCIDLNSDLKFGWCICAKNYTVNENYSSSSDKSEIYCIERNSSSNINTTAATPLVTSTASSKTNASKIVTTTQLPSSAAAPPTQPTTTTIENKKAPVVVSTESTLNKKSTPSPAATTTNAAKVETITPIASNATTKNKTESNSAKPQAHHFLGGILLPLAFVLALAGVAYGVKKYDVIERAQNFVRSRRSGGQPHQTRYDGLENDFDDDPLLI